MLTKVYIGENEDNLKCSLCRGAIEDLLGKRFKIGRKNVKVIFILCREATRPYIVEQFNNVGIKKSRLLARAVEEIVNHIFSENQE